MKRYFLYLSAGAILWLAAWAGELAVRLGFLSSFGPPEVLRCYSLLDLVFLPGLIYAVPGLVIGAVFPVLRRGGSPARTFSAFVSLNAAVLFLFYAGTWIHLSVLAGIGQLEAVSVAATLILLSLALLVYVLFGRSPLGRVSPRVLLTRCSVLVLAVSAFFWYLTEPGTGTGPAGSRERGRDILIVTLDTVRRDALGCYGNSLFATPTLDSLAREGSVLAEAVSQSPFTAPSHASLFTGLYPASHRIRTNGMHLGEGALTLARFLTDHDYRCAAVLSGSSLSHDECGLNEGFVIYDDVLTPFEGFMRTSLGESVLRLFKKMKPDSFTRLFRKLQERKAAATTDRAVSYLSRMDGRAFLWVHYFDAHFTYEPPAPFDTMYDPGWSGRFRPYDHLSQPFQIFDNTIEITERERQHAWALYGGEMAYLDREFGRLLAGIDGLGRLDDMLIVVVSDHGEYFGEYGKYFMHDGLAEEVLKVPIIMLDPGGSLAGLETGLLAEVVDIMPTILQISKLPVPDRLQGRSLLTAAEERTYAFSDCGPCGKVSVRGPDSMLILDLAGGETEVHPLNGTDGPVADEEIALLRSVIETWVADVGLAGENELISDESERLKSLGYIQ